MSGSMLLLPVFVPIAAGIAMLNITKMKERKVRDWYVGIVLLFSLLCAAFFSVRGMDLEYRAHLGGFLFLLRQDGLARIFATLTSVGWIANGFFSFEYMSKEENQVQFFAFYLMADGLINGFSYAGSYGTMKLFYILISVAIIPLIVHRQDEKSVQAALYYAAFFLIGLIGLEIGGGYVSRFLTSKEFVAGGSLDAAAVAGHEGMFLFMAFLLIVSYSIKSCLFPFHGWTKIVTEAAPVAASGAISGVVTKTGIIAVIRIVASMIGADILRDTWVQYVWMVLAVLSIFIGAVLAYKTDALAERMAYSTVGQVGCVLYGVSLMENRAITGALVLLTAHTLASLVLFFTVGAIVYQTGYKRASELRGIGRQVPHMMFCFSLVSFVIMGIPPTLGFVGDWNVSLGALETSIPCLPEIGIVIFIFGELFAAGYQFNIILRGFFPGERYDYVHENVCRPSLFTRLPAYLLTAAVYVIGFYPVLLLKLIEQALQGMAL